MARAVVVMPKQRKRIFRWRDLSMIAGCFQFAAAIDDRDRNFVRAPGRFGIQRRGHLLQLRIKRVEKYQSPFTGQRGQQLCEGIAKLSSGLISSAQKLFEIVAEFGLGQRGQQTLNARLDCFVQHDPADRNPVGMYFGGNADATEGAIAIDDFGFRNFRKVVILGGNPKDRNGFDAPLRHAFGEFYCRERLINRVERTGEKTCLLSGDDGDAIGFA